ncbi:Nucleolar Complex 2 protein [Physocladia obscura]|uniref:Nucleolar Complex 2 protein n=1 Tax=Physocladia obscura TaxID=109957 RepID=A0AAD5T507_9FUNG|nr:Nucleolar Complex 2 protein [Physocladia obscura]
MGTNKQTKKFAKNHLKDKVDRSRKWKKDNKGRILREALKKKRMSNGNDKDSQKNANDQALQLDKDAEMGFIASEEHEQDLDSNSDNGSETDILEIDEIENFSGGENDENDEDYVKDGSDIDEESEDDEGENNDEQSKKSTTKAAKSHLRAEIAEHKRQLEAALAKDPEFFKFLQENDEDLLNFGEGDDDNDNDMSDGEDLEKIMRGEQQNDNEDDDDSSGHPIEITNKMLASWKSSLVNKKSLKAAKKVILALRAVVSEGETDTENEVRHYIVGSQKFANAITVLALKNISGIFNHYLPVKVNKGKTSLPTNSKNWAKISPLVKSFLKTLLRVMGQASDEVMLRFIMREAEKCALYFACFDRYAKDLLKQLLTMWTSTTPETRITCFLTIRRLAITCPNPYLDYAIKSTYQSYNVASRETNLHTWSSIGFMANCFVELIGLDVAAGYRFGFIFLRSLASSLRNAITSKSTNAFNKVYSWQFVNALRLWTRVLTHFCEPGTSAESAGGKTLRPLIYPLVQIILGTMRLKPSAKYLPLRFQCAHMIIDICKKTSVFIPLASHLFELFDTAELRATSGKPSTHKPLNFLLTLKAPAQILGTRTYQTGIVDELVQLLTEYYDCFALSIAFPELVVPAVVQLRRWVKRSRNVNANKQVQSLVESLELNAKFIEGKRTAIVDFAPKDEAKVTAFLADVDETASPLRRHAIARRKMRDAQVVEMQKLAEETKPAVTFLERKGPAGKNKKKGSSQADSDDEDENSDDDSVSGDASESEQESEDEEFESEDELEFEDEDENEEEMEN